MSVHVVKISQYCLVDQLLESITTMNSHTLLDQWWVFYAQVYPLALMVTAKEILEITKQVTFTCSQVRIICYYKQMNSRRVFPPQMQRNI